MEEEQEQLEQEQQEETPAKTWEEERAELEQKAADLAAQLHTTRVSAAFYRKASAAGIVDPDKLAGIVNLSGITFDDAGNAQGIDEILTAVTATAPRTQPISIGGPGGGGEPYVRSKAHFLAEAAERARNSGRAEDVAAYAALKHQTK
ncbi:phage scaffolding protein [Paenibacillus sp. Marseille-Q9583]